MSANKRFLKAAASFLAILCLLPGCEKESPVSTYEVPDFLETPSQTAYQTTTVEMGQYVITRSASATAIRLLSADLKWEGGDARYGQVFVEKRQQVKAGDVLMEFEVAVSQADLAALRLEWTRMTQELENQKAILQDQINAKKQEAAMLDSYDRRIAELEVAEMEAAYDAYVFSATQSIYDVDARVLELERIEKNNVLVAPFDGVIDSVIRFNPGDSVSKSSVLIKMHATDKLLLEAKDVYGQLHYNMPVTIQTTIQGDEKVFEGRVVACPSIMPVSIPQNKVLIQLEKGVTESDLGPNLRYDAEVEIVQDVLTVCADAVNHDNGTDFVYVLEDGMLKKKYVITKNDRSDPIWILEGLSQGQTLVID